MNQTTYSFVCCSFLCSPPGIAPYKGNICRGLEDWQDGDDRQRAEFADYHQRFWLDVSGSTRGCRMSFNFVVCDSILTNTPWPDLSFSIYVCNQGTMTPFRICEEFCELSNQHKSDGCDRSIVSDQQFCNYVNYPMYHWSLEEDCTNPGVSDEYRNSILAREVCFSTFNVINKLIH